MPLHLLGKKSWNVYNERNIERVRRDEAEAAARQDAADQRMQEEDAARRTAILRGETPAALPVSRSPSPVSGSGKRKRAEGAEEKRRPRKRRGEDDTDLELRLARDVLATKNVAGQKTALATSQRTSGSDENTQLVDERGHISLFPEPATHNPRAAAEGDPRRNQWDRDREKHERRRAQKEDRERQREADAAKGVKFDAAGGRSLWYANQPVEVTSRQVTATDAFGNDDPDRDRRDQLRLAASDPMAIMREAQKGLALVRENRSKRQAAARVAFSNDAKVTKSSRRERRSRHGRIDRDHASNSADRRRRSGSDALDSLDDFSLDGPESTNIEWDESRDRSRRHQTTRPRE